MPLWQRIPKRNLTKQLQELDTRPNPDTGAYGPTVITDNIKPKEVVSLQSRGMTTAELDAEETKLKTRGGEYDYLCEDGVTYHGIPVAVNSEPEDRSWDTLFGVFWVVTIDVRITTL